MCSVAVGQVVKVQLHFSIRTCSHTIWFLYVFFSPVYFLLASHRAEFEAFVKSCKVADDSSRHALKYVGAHGLACTEYWVHTANRAVRSGGSAYALAPRTAERIGSLKLKVLQVITTIV